jgi:hypothetical protein
MSRTFSVTLLAALLTTSAFAQDLADRPLQKLIDCPTAGGPATGSYDFELRAYPGGGLLAGISVGLFQRFTVGLSYGGSDVIGYSAPDWNPQPGVAASFRIINESRLLPALAVGFTNQGYGAWLDSLDRYQFKAKGFYGVMGKYFTWGPIGETGIHFGANRNPVEKGDKKVDLFFAVDYWATRQLAVIAEYSAALDDWKGDGSFGMGRGYLNAGLRWSFGERLAIDLNLRDLLNNQEELLRGGSQIGREIRICYEESL